MEKDKDVFVNKSVKSKKYILDNLSAEELYKGIILSEILGKPLSKRRKKRIYR